jgi:predicted RNA-binding protein YlxR (DUF448 family)
MPISFESWKSFVASALEAKKRSPERTCVGCRRRFSLSELRRFVHTPGGWRPDSPGRRGKQPGRGAYLCSDQCVQRSAKNKRYPGLGAVAVECGLIKELVQEANR